MRTLYLIRHAKSSWKDPGLDDFDRPLNKRGEDDAPVMGKRLDEQGIRPGLMITSPAKRATTTARRIAKEVGYSEKKIEENEAIYGGGVRQLLEVIQEIDDSNDQAMLFGHNPGLTSLALELTDAGIDNIPTCGIFCIRFAVGSWKDVDSGRGEVVFFDYPKKEAS